MKLTRTEIERYRHRWSRLAAKLPRLKGGKARKVLGKKVVVNSMGGGCWCLLNFGRCAGLSKSGLQVDHFFGCSAGSMAGLAFIDLDFFEEMIIQLVLEINQNERNLYPLNFLKGLSPLPHHRMLRTTIQRTWSKVKKIKQSRTRLTTVLTRHWSRWTFFGYLLALVSFALQVGMARRWPLLGEGRLFSFDHVARGPHLKWARKIGLFPAPYSLPTRSGHKEIDHFTMATMSLWPFLPFYQKENDFFTDGSLLTHNAMAYIAESQENIDTLITLPTEPLQNYSPGFLGISGYRNLKRISPLLTICSDPQDPRIPRQHILWDRPTKSRLGIFDYTDPHATLQEVSQGYEESSHFLRDLGLT